MALMTGALGSMVEVEFWVSTGTCVPTCKLAVPLFTVISLGAETTLTLVLPSSALSTPVRLPELPNRKLKPGTSRTSPGPVVESVRTAFSLPSMKFHCRP